MRHSNLLIAVALALTALSAAAQPQSPPMQGQRPQNAPEARPGQSPKSFEQMKAFTLKAITAREAVLQKEKSCVQAATAPRALHDCREAAMKSRAGFGDKMRAEHGGEGRRPIIHQANARAVSRIDGK